MKRLENMFEEIENSIEENTEVICDEDGTNHFVLDTSFVRIVIKQIIQKHLSDTSETKENDDWVSCSDVLPKTNGVYNVTRFTEGHYISDVAYFDGQDTWHNDNRVNHSRKYLKDVVYWKPLPKPYKKSE